MKKTKTSKKAADFKQYLWLLVIGVVGLTAFLFYQKLPSIQQLAPKPLGFGYAIASTKRSQAALYTKPIIPLKEFTFEAWIKPSQFSAEWTEGYLFSQKLTEEAATPQVSLALAGNSQFNKGKGELRARFYDPQPREVTSGYVVDPGQWHHIAWVNDDTSVRLYVDGAKKAQASANEFYQPNPINLIIGNYNLNQTYRQYYGSLDEVRISDIARYFGDLVLLKMEPFTPDGNTVALYDFNDDITDTLGRYNLNINGSVDFVYSDILPPSATPTPLPTTKPTAFPSPLIVPAQSPLPATTPQPAVSPRPSPPPCPKFCFGQRCIQLPCRLK